MPHACTVAALCGSSSSAKEAKRTEEPAAAAAASGRGGALPDRSLLLPDSSSWLGALAVAAPASNDRRGS